MTMSSVILQAAFGLACAAVGFFIGLSLSWREYRLAGGRKIAAPDLPRTDRQQLMWLMVVAALAVASAAYAGLSTAQQSGCNSDFREAIVARSQISTENQKHLDTMIDAVADAAGSPSPEVRAQAGKALVDYRAWSIEAARQRAANPLPDPVCGGGR